MDWKIEQIVVPVADIDRAKSFYERAGFVVDVDHRAGDFRVVQLTPSGSACSIALLTTSPMAPGTLHGVHLVVPDIERARTDLVGRGIDVGELFHFDQMQQVPGPDPDRASYATFCSFDDPDGNSWLVQEVRASADSA